MSDITKRLSRLQKSLKAPKEKNANVSYKSRSAEQILEAAKEQLQEGEIIKCTDEIVLIGNRYYVKAVSQFKFGGEVEEAVAYAREPEEVLSNSGKPMMSPAQVTGSSSSYARKYSLQGLFALDDSKDDPDKNEVHEVPTQAIKPDERYKNAKSYQSEIVNKISLCKSVDELEVLLNNEHDKLERIRENYPDLWEAIEYQENSVRDGGPIANPILKFASVGDAEQWAKSRTEFLDLADLQWPDLEIFERDFMPFLISKDGKPSALDKTLSAAKYQKDGKSPSERIIEKFKFKLTALQSNQG